MKRIRSLAGLSLALAVGNLTAQAQTPLSFFPHAAGNVWQYRDGFSGQVYYTRYNDSIWISGDTSVFISGRRIPGSPILERIGTAYNLFNLQFQPNYPRYKLAADSGDSWQAGTQGSDPVVATVTDVFQDYVFSVLTTIKVYRFEIVRSPPQPRFWLGDDYLASGFGLVQSRIEPTLNLYLAGAIIDSALWGQIVSVGRQITLPEKIVLFPNFPNPFNPSTQIKFDLPEAGNISLVVYDVLGREVANLATGYRDAGYHTATWNATGQASGVYFARFNLINAEGKIAYAKVSKLVLTK